MLKSMIQAIQSLVLSKSLNLGVRFTMFALFIKLFSWTIVYFTQVIRRCANSLGPFIFPPNFLCSLNLLWKNKLILCFAFYFYCFICSNTRFGTISRWQELIDNIFQWESWLNIVSSVSATPLFVLLWWPR